MCGVAFFASSGTTVVTGVGVSFAAGIGCVAVGIAVAFGLGQRIVFGWRCGTAVTLAFVATVGTWALDVLAGVADALTVFAVLIFGTADTVTGVLRNIDALSIFANLVFLTRHFLAGVGLTFSVFAGRAVYTIDVGASLHTLAFSTEGTVLTSDLGAGICHTFALLTTETVFTANGGAVVVGWLGHTSAANTNFAALALNVFANVDALAVLARFIVATADTTAGIFDTSAVDASESTASTFLLTGFETETFDTLGTVVGGFYIIDSSVAVVVTTVAEFGDRLLCVTLFPTSVDTDLLTSTTDASARAAKVVINFAVAVVVFSVTNFGFRLGSGAVYPLSSLAGFGTCTTRGLAALCEAFVNLTIAVIVDIVAGFLSRFASATLAPFTSGTGFVAFFTLAGTGTVDLIDLSVTIVVFVVAGFGLGLGCGAAAELTSFAGFDALTALGRTGTLQAIIDFTVAVVIYVVTGLGGGLTLGRTSSPLSFGASRSSRTAVAGTGFGQTFINLAITVIISVVAYFGGSCVGDVFHGGVQFGAAVGLVVFSGAASSSSAGCCNVIEAAWANTSTKANHVGLVASFEEVGCLDLSTGGLTICEEHDAALAAFDGVCSLRSVKVGQRCAKSSLKVGPTTSAVTAELGLQVRHTVVSSSTASYQAVSNSRAAVENDQPKAQLTFVGVGDGSDCTGCLGPLGSPHTSGLIQNNQQIWSSTRGLRCLNSCAEQYERTTCNNSQQPTAHTGDPLCWLWATNQVHLRHHPLPWN